MNRQRLQQLYDALASRILILDEATSALDAETEREILDELDDVTKDTTVISITHRLALAMRADRIGRQRGWTLPEDGAAAVRWVVDELSKDYPKSEIGRAHV